MAPVAKVRTRVRAIAKSIRGPHSRKKLGVTTCGTILCGIILALGRELYQEKVQNCESSLEQLMHE